MTLSSVNANHKHKDKEYIIYKEIKKKKSKEKKEYVLNKGVGFNHT